MEICFKNITFSYDENEFINIDEIKLKNHQIINLIGKNGSGKSTLGKIIAKLEDSNDLQVFFNNKEINIDDLKVNLVLQNPDFQFVRSFVLDDIAFGLENENMNYEQMHKKINEFAKKMDIVDLLEKPISELSGGQKQKVAIISNLILNPDILILDEAFEMIDIQSRQQIIEIIIKYAKENNVIIINITHDEQIIKLFDRSMIMDKGEIIFDGNTKEMFKNKVLIDNQYFKVPFAIKVQNLLEKE